MIPAFLLDWGSKKQAQWHPSLTLPPATEGVAPTAHCAKTVKAKDSRRLTKMCSMMKPWDVCVGGTGLGRARDSFRCQGYTQNILQATEDGTCRGQLPESRCKLCNPRSCKLRMLNAFNRNHEQYRSSPTRLFTWLLQGGQAFPVASHFRAAPNQPGNEAGI